MDTSKLVCSLSSVIQTRIAGQWNLASCYSLCAICTNGHLQFGTIQCTEDRTNRHAYVICAYCTKIFEHLDDIKTQSYDCIEKQSIKNSLRKFLQGTEAILPDRWETLFCLEGDYTQAFSPCNGNTYNCIHIRRQTVELFAGRLSNPYLWYCGLEDVRFFYCLLVREHGLSNHIELLNNTTIRQ